MGYSLQQTANGLGQQLNQIDSMEELLPLLRRFTVRWEQNVVLGDNRWQSENIREMQRYAKGLSKELLKFDSEYSELWSAEVRNQMHIFSTELRRVQIALLALLGPTTKNEQFVVCGLLFVVAWCGV